MSLSPIPSQIRIRRGSRCLELTYANGTCRSLPFEYLRVYSPSAEVRGHGASEGRLVSGKKEVMVEAAEPVGNYALKLIFDDGHDSGLYTWAYLQALGEEYESRWADYLSRLEQAGLGRQPQGPGSPQIFPGR